MPEQRQGKCGKCGVRYVWPAKFMRLQDAYCPVCGRKLQATTHLLQWPVVNQRPVRYVAARAIQRRSQTT